MKKIRRLSWWGEVEAPGLMIRHLRREEKRCVLSGARKANLVLGTGRKKASIIKTDTGFGYLNHQEAHGSLGTRSSVP